MFRQHLLDRSGHEFAVLRVYGRQVLLECGSPLVGVKSVDLGQLWRPIVVKSRRVKRPASHVGESFAFAEVVRTSFKLLRCSLEIFNVGRGRIPADNISVLIRKRVVPEEKPSKLPVSTADPELRFKGYLPGMPAGPFKQHPLKITWMDNLQSGVR